MPQLIYHVPPEYDGQPAGQFLRRGCGLSWRMVVRAKNTPDGITADGVFRRTIDPVYAGQAVTVRWPEDTVELEPYDAPVDVVYEDEHVIVIHKPAGLPVHPSAGLPPPTLANMMVHYFAQSGTPRAFRPLNRLDRNTSGLLLAAKDAPTAYALRGTCQKEYDAIALGQLRGSGVIDQPIRIAPGSAITREVGEGGKPSVTRWCALAHNEAATLLRVVIDTGRTHQIRVHMAWLGHPLAGDTMYGEDQTVMTRHALHCGRMTFTHPFTGEKIALSCPMPTDMKEVADTMAPLPSCELPPPVIREKE